MIFITQCDSPAFWQTYLSDHASITMEGILIFNKHLLFLLTAIVLFVGWLLFYTIYYFIEYSNKFSTIHNPLKPGLEEVVQATKKKKKLAPKASLGTQKKNWYKDYFGADVRIWVPGGFVSGVPFYDWQTFHYHELGMRPTRRVPPIDWVLHMPRNIPALPFVNARTELTLFIRHHGKLIHRSGAEFTLDQWEKNFRGRVFIDTMLGGAHGDNYSLDYVPIESVFYPNWVG